MSRQVGPQAVTPQHRFFDDRKCLCAYSDPILIRCPKCKSPGTLRLPKEASVKGRWQARRFFGCEACGHSFIWKPQSVIHSISDWNTVLPLLLQTSCCGKTLWVFNEAHLSFIQDYASALIRERSGSSNASLASRLPQWIKSARNREAVLKAAAKLKRSLLKAELG
jgi:hypothetical protein